MGSKLLLALSLALAACDSASLNSSEAFSPGDFALVFAPVDLASPASPVSPTDAAVAPHGCTRNADCPAAAVCCMDGCQEVLTNPDNCGSCGNRCLAGPHALSTCTQGLCRNTCVPGYGDCNLLPQDGCEVDLTTDAAHCGSCAHVCNQGQPQQMVCQVGACVVAPPVVGNCANPVVLAAGVGKWTDARSTSLQPSIETNTSQVNALDPLWPVDCSGIIAGGPEVVYLVSPAPSARIITARLCLGQGGNASYDTVVYVRSGSCTGRSAVQVTCNDEGCQLHESRVHWIAAPNTPYWLIIDGYGLAKGSYMVALDGL